MRATIAFVSQPWARARPPSESAAIWTREVARRLAGEFDVVVYGRGGARGLEIERDEGVEYRLVAAELDWRAMKATAPLARLRRARRPRFAGYLFHPAYLLAVARDVARLRPAVVHVHNFSQLLPLLRRATPKSRLVVHMHCEWLSQLARPLVARRLRHADLVAGCSEHVVGGIRRRFPDLAPRCHVLVNGVDVNRFRPSHDPSSQRLVFTGRVAPDKGLHILCDAFSQVVRVHPRAELELVGPEAPVALEMQVALSDDPRVRALRSFYGQSYVEALRARLGEAASHVRFHGPVPFDDMPARYAGAAMVVTPSLEEAFGMALVEGMATGLPAVATTVGGMPEVVVQGQTGLLVPPGDADALARSIGQLLADPVLASRLGMAGRERAVAQFSWDVVAAEVLRRYRALLGRGH